MNRQWLLETSRNSRPAYVRHTLERFCRPPFGEGELARACVFVEIAIMNDVPVDQETADGITEFLKKRRESPSEIRYSRSKPSPEELATMVDQLIRGWRNIRIRDAKQRDEMDCRSADAKVAGPKPQQL